MVNVVVAVSEGAPEVSVSTNWSLAEQFDPLFWVTVKPVKAVLDAPVVAVTVGLASDADALALLAVAHNSASDWLLTWNVMKSPAFQPLPAVVTPSGNVKVMLLNAWFATHG
jgi:hypothetical protein